MLYLYIKAFHLVAVIAWMVGLLYLPRLYVYHAETDVNSITYEYFLLMEKRLIKIIMLPSMILTLILGLGLIHYNNEIIYEVYFIIKVALLIILYGFHGFLIKTYKRFEKKDNLKTPNFYRTINEIPTVIMILIIILVVVKPNLL